MAVDGDSTRGGVVEPRQQRSNRRFARTAGPDQCHNLTSGHRKIEPIEHRLTQRVSEFHVFESDITAHGRQHDGVGLVDDQGGGVKYIEHTLCTGSCLLRSGENNAHHAHGGNHLHEITREGQERAETDAPASDERAAQGQDRHLSEYRHSPQSGRVFGEKAHKSNARTKQLARRGHKASLLPVLLAESLYDAHAAHGFIDHTRDLARSLLRMPCSGKDESTGAHRQGQQQRK